MTTAAKTRGSEGSHFYFSDGTPAYEVPYADPRKGTRPTTLADARKMNLLPSVTTILRVLHKQALVDWLIEQAVLAVLTTPRLDGETDDAFAHRVLHTERVQDQESQAARDRGTEIHAAMELLFSGRSAAVGADLLSWVVPAYQAISAYGKTVACERVVVGLGYAGRVDLIQETPDAVWLWDYKTAKKLPAPAKGGAWPDHRLQLAAYARARPLRMRNKIVRTGNVYISTVDQGKFVICEHEDWYDTYVHGFCPLVEHWQWATGYTPRQ